MPSASWFSGRRRRHSRRLSWRGAKRHNRIYEREPRTRRNLPPAAHAHVPGVRH
jgi:hypothetical protein